jgi:AcrR family transcriptional regulator
MFFATEDAMPPRARSRASSGDPRQRLITAALELAATKGWRRTELGEIAARARVPLDEAYGLFRTKFGILAAFRRSIDAAVLRHPVPGADEPARDRLFDVLMRRFEALKPYRAGLRAILRDSIGDPRAAAALPGLLRSMAWMRQAAGLPAAGCRGRIACRLTAALYMSIVPVFLRDESADLGSTMAALDRRLRQAESLLGAFRPMAEAVRKSRN